MHTDKEKIFIRQTTLPEIGLLGQEKIGKAKITIIGCGGLGSAAAVYLAASGIGHLHLIDYDRIDLQAIYTDRYFTDMIRWVSLRPKPLQPIFREISPYVKVSYSEAAYY